MSDMRLEMPRSRQRSDDRFAFRALVALTYPMFLVAAVASCLLPAGQGLLARPSGRVSIFAQARRASEATIAFAFMG